MNYVLPSEQLSPTQLQALTSLESGTPTEIRSTSINRLIEILNLLVHANDTTISCNPHTFRLLHNYKERHSQTETALEVETLADVYHRAIKQFKDKLSNL